MVWSLTYIGRPWQIIAHLYSVIPYLHRQASGRELYIFIVQALTYMGRPVTGNCISLWCKPLLTWVGHLRELHIFMVQALTYMGRPWQRIAHLHGVSPYFHGQAMAENCTYLWCEPWLICAGHGREVYIFMLPDFGRRSGQRAWFKVIVIQPASVHGHIRTYHTGGQGT